MAAFYGGGNLSEQKLQEIRDLHLDIETRLLQSPGEFVLSIITTLEQDGHPGPFSDIRPVPQDHVYLSIVGDEGMVVDFNERICQVSPGKPAHFLKNFVGDDKIDLHKSELTFHGLLPEDNWNNFRDPVINMQFAIGDQDVREWFKIWESYRLHVAFWKMAGLIGRPIAEYPELAEELRKKRADVQAEIIKLWRQLYELEMSSHSSEMLAAQSTLKNRLERALYLELPDQIFPTLPDLCRNYGIEV